jgi:hypothetical protein
MIAGISKYILMQQQNIQDIADVWESEFSQGKPLVMRGSENNVLFSVDYSGIFAANDELRLCLFYVMNDVVQASVKKYDNGVMANKVIDHITRAVRMAAEEGSTVLPKISRTINVWHERNIYSSAALNKMTRAIKDRQGETHTEHKPAETEAAGSPKSPKSENTKSSSMERSGIGPEQSPLLQVASCIPEEDKDRWQGDPYINSVMSAQNAVHDEEMVSTFNDRQYVKVKGLLKQIALPQNAIESSELMKSHQVSASSSGSQTWSVVPESEISEEASMLISMDSVEPILQQRKEQFQQDKTVRKELLDKLQDLLNQEKQALRHDKESIEEADKTLQSVTELREKTLQRLKSLQKGTNGHAHASSTAKQRPPPSSRNTSGWDVDGDYAFTPIDDPPEDNQLSVSLYDEGDDYDEYDPYEGL